MSFRSLLLKRSWSHVLFEASKDQIAPPPERPDLDFRDCTGRWIDRRYRDFFLEAASWLVWIRTNLWMMRGRAWYFVTLCDGTPAHYTTAYSALRGRPKFPDIDTTGVLFGPCYTRSQFRGKSIYPFTLQKAVHLLAAKGVTRFYIDCASVNTPSIQGILKSGFERVGEYTGTTACLGVFHSARRVIE